MSRRFVAYLRIAAGEQERSSHDLEAQRAAVAGLIVGREDGLLTECVEVEGNHGNARPELARALDLCRGHGATLAIARLAPLARDAAFLAGLVASGVEVVAADIPQANRQTLHVLAALAEHEKEMASRRTRAALEAASARGVRLGNPRAAEAAAKGRAVLEARAAPVRQAALPLVLTLRNEGLSLRRIADALNTSGVATPRGGRWHAATVAALLQQATAAAPAAVPNAAKL